MNVFFVTSWFPSRVHPTNGNFIGRHARLMARHHRVTVVAVEEDLQLAPGKLDVTRRTEDGYAVIHVYVGYGPQTPGPVKAALRLRAYVVAMRAARKKFGRPDLLHGHVLLDGGMAAALYSGFWNLPFVLTEHSSAYHKANALSGFRGWLGRYACRNAVAILPVSDHLGRSMRERNRLAGNYRTVSNVVDEKTYLPGQPSPTLPFRLLHVSNFDEAPKNITGLLRGFSLLRQKTNVPVTLHLAGDGDLEILTQMIDDLGVAGITCSGPHTEGEIAELMQDCHAFVLFSNYENQPVVLLEAQMCGRPCIATPVGGVPDIVLHGETGLLVPVGDAVALAGAFEKMRDEYTSFDPEVIRERALQLYSEEAVLEAINSVYQLAVEDGAAYR
ncbi:glycosyltransferase family 4 protein [Neolewinella aurantiaca]|uniref:Glycosyltransferase family 4 protein n=1 Tax=Neolewinella aurantiaca TaxID=2602767 RepID=A0A5C7FIR1_9BACT|nr:glycosyltransferase [Neolewinella aurantiaca]TXF89691.1 glycosyltransferase family 4 protein [Neolewinella aurantiaca]